MNFISDSRIYSEHWECDAIKEKNSLKTLKKIIKQRIYINPIKECCYYQHYKSVKYLLSLSVSIDKELLLLAISTCNLRIINLLIKHDTQSIIDEVKKDEIYCFECSENYSRLYKRKYKNIMKIIFGLQEKRQNAAKIIQAGCDNWLYKPKCKDNTVGIIPRLDAKKFTNDNC